MTKTEAIRVLKSMQTGTIQQEAALVAMRATAVRMDDVHSGDRGVLEEELLDAAMTARNHADALQHAIDRLGSR